MNIPFHRVSNSDEEASAVREVLESGWWTTGPKSIEFEDKFCSTVNSKYALAVSSCTAALHMALEAVGVSDGDEVILPTNTFVATIEAVCYLGARPVLCDINSYDHNIDPDKIEDLVSERTKAIIPVHFGGIPCDMDRIMSIAKLFQLKVIEDAAHALPSYYNNTIIGSFSDITCFSFYATKTLSTGEGGMVTTDNPDYFSRMKVNRIHGISGDAWKRYSSEGKWRYDIVSQGYKYNMSDINAAIGLVQLDKVFKNNDKREAIARRYIDAFDTNGLDYIKHKNNVRSSWHLFVLKVSNRDILYNKLADCSIGASVHFIPLHFQTFYKKKFNFQKELFPISNDVFKKSISIPIFPDLTEQEQEYIISKVLENAKA